MALPDSHIEKEAGLEEPPLEVYNKSPDEHKSDSQSKLKRSVTSNGKLLCFDLSSLLNFCTCGQFQTKEAINKLTIERVGEPIKLGNQTELTSEQTTSGSTEQKNNWDVLIQLRHLENKYEHRERYQSIFGDTPLYQVYTQKVSRQKSIRAAKRVLTAKQALIKLEPGTERNVFNNLEFDDKLFVDIDADDMDEGSSLLYPPVKPENEITRPTTSVSELIKHFESDKVANDAKISPPPQQDSNLPAKPQSTSTTEINNFVDVLAGSGPNRVRWCDMPQVIAANTIANLQPHQKKLQEALFEIITSEASYYRTLNIFIEKYYKSPIMQPGNKDAIVNAQEKHHLCSNILEIYLASQNLLSEMESYFRYDPMLTTLCEIMYQNSEFKFDCYVRYVQNQIYQLRTLEKLLVTPTAVVALKQLQTESSCEFLGLDSYLLLPMQRVTRLRLLVIAVLHYADKNTITFHSALIALASLEQLLSKCDAKKSYMEQKERLMDLCQKLEYKVDAKALATASRTLFKEGNLCLLTLSNMKQSSFYRTCGSLRRSKLHKATLFLFSDQLLIVRARRQIFAMNNEQLLVEDSCSRDQIQVEIRFTPQNCMVHIFYHPDHNDKGRKPNHVTYSNSLILGSNGEKQISEDKVNLEENQSDIGIVNSSFPFVVIIGGLPHTRKEYEFQTDSLANRERWVDALCPKYYGIPQQLGTDICECPQVIITQTYSATECDEMDLKAGDQVSVLISLSDGWLKGAIADGRRGWFPAHICVEVQDATMKRENMKNFLLMEEAKAAYALRKNRENATYSNY